MYTTGELAARWASTFAPETSDARGKLVGELSEFLRLTREETEARLSNAVQRFQQEWEAKVANASDEASLIRFYNESETEIFDLVQWHASDPIHHRTLVCLDQAVSKGGGRHLIDYGSGIGNDAIVFGQAGYEVTLADVSTPLLKFAAWRCARRGLAVKILDLRTETLPPHAYDVAVCFDVLEHVPRPLHVLRRLHAALVPGGLLFLHAPFGADPDRPMHIVHEDPLTNRMRVAGFHWREDLEKEFPTWFWAPQVFEAIDLRAFDRLGYYLHDVMLPTRAAAILANWYRRVVPRRGPHPASA
jgi:2-polyprenyl-3-methyl-5-hydroxy-6-metoxy-1,4-benzoquinol methylase